MLKDGQTGLGHIPLSEAMGLIEGYDLAGSHGAHADLGMHQKGTTV
jgi:hypothetical protein